MLERLKAGWRQFRSETPGRRFRERYARRRHEPRGPVRSTLIMLLGAALVLLGTVMLVTPGPGILILVLGAGLIAEESLVAAKLLDRLEIGARRLFRRRGARKS